ncbi:cupin domain-containing protein [Pseudoprimorskyibacter insulae]|uniref:Quercetin 2,3-dioxygenase n=1 Tax=Pseudoprimorskyibacter insulae TaxID=1695997 RepID=A0A2R8AZ86_9RHOB|nr:cupin domain-containing protein [Pseudoprimorskyibacter insulae]SPF81159.1 Quercetin 2,3-dioxygenase [Pseudoprimorskyibacter insulae]
MKDHILGPGAMDWNGVLYKTALSTEETGGAMSITDSVSPPLSGPPRHIHHKEDEAFFILTGEATFWIDGEVFTKGPGEAAFIPRGKAHTFQIFGDQPCRHLVILTPGGFENFFAEMAKRQCRIPEDLPTIGAIGKDHSMDFVGGPLTAEEAGL